jgi:IS30 family transposase
VATNAPTAPTAYAKAIGPQRTSIPDLVSISERPASVEDRSFPGLGEGDLIAGSKNSYVVTLVERHSRFTMLMKAPGKDTKTVVSALAKHVKKLPVELRKSITWDRGSELASHRRFTIATDVKVYFCDASAPWQRGSNENTNGLLRQYLPKGTDLSRYSQTELNKFARRLNERPRKTLGFRNPAAVLELALRDRSNSQPHCSDSSRGDRAGRTQRTGAASTRAKDACGSGSRARRPFVGAIRSAPTSLERRATRQARSRI